MKTKKLYKTVILLLLAVILVVSVSCRPKVCRSMRHHDRDVKRGLAH